MSNVSALRTKPTTPTEERALYKIEHGVPVPPRQAIKSPFPFWDMKKGDSFFVPCEADGAELQLKRLYNTASRFGARNHCKFTVRTVEGGVRCWRIE